MASYIGIDLGTAYSAVATIDDTGRPKILLNNGRNITPSCVLVENDKLIVGEKPESRLGLKGFEVGARFKRNMGEDISISIGSKEYTPTDLSAAVLSEMKKVAENSIGQIAEAVVTIPANFMQEARDATMMAAKKAGLTVKYIINEPTAAALFYGYQEGEELNGYYVVYDLGGGTFDVSVVKINGHDVEVVATEGVAKLGGDDFDRALQNLIKRKFEDQYGRELSNDELALADVVKRKHDLSERPITRHLADGEIIEITRDEFEEEISALISQTELLCETVLEEAGIGISDVKKVFLAGGSTRIPCVRLSIERAFGKEPTAAANVDEVVALGAALYAALKSDGVHLSTTQKSSVNRLKVAEIATYYFGTLSIGFNQARNITEMQNSIIINKGEKIPCTRTEEFYTVSDNQTAVNCKVTRSASPETDPRFVTVVWDGDMNLPEGRPAEQKIEITYAFDENGMMQCRFHDVESGKSRDVELGHSFKENPTSNIDKFLVD